MHDRIPNVDQPLAAAEASGKLTSSAARHIRKWLQEPAYADYRSTVMDHIERGDWSTLDDVFWTVIPFGTGGRRGRMYPIGCNAINDRTIGESAQGLADYVRSQQQGPYSCAIAYDTRHRSDEFAQLSARILAAADFQVYFLTPGRGTPELSFAIRHFGCSCGIMVTASHNPPSDNAVKVYWSTGGQLLPPHDRGVIERVETVTEIHQVPFDEAVRRGQIIDVTDEVDRAYQAAVVHQQHPGSRNVRILYSPLHGVGSTAVPPVLAAAGFSNVQTYPPHAEPNGDFPNVPGHVANPENPEVFASMIEMARREQYELVLVTDPDCDRVGCAAPVTGDLAGPWGTFTGNQIAALLTQYVLERKRQAGELTSMHYVVKTLVTTDLVRKIADAYQVRMVGELHVGFKWIAGAMDENGPDRFVIGAEESHGYLVGTYARDKDAAVAALLLAELTADLRDRRRTLHDQLNLLFGQYGYHGERLINLQMPGSDGMARMQELMQGLRERMPTELAGYPIVQMRDYGQQIVRFPDGTSEPLSAPQGEMLFIDFDREGNSIAVRPSGTEPKMKFYLFAVQPPEHDGMATARAEVEQRLDALTAAIRALV